MAYTFTHDTKSKTCRIAWLIFMGRFLSRQVLVGSRRERPEYREPARGCPESPKSSEGDSSKAQRLRERGAPTTVPRMFHAPRRHQGNLRSVRILVAVPLENLKATSRPALHAKAATRKETCHDRNGTYHRRAVRRLLVRTRRIAAFRAGCPGQSRRNALPRASHRHRPQRRMVSLRRTRRRARARRVARRPEPRLPSRRAWIDARTASSPCATARPSSSTPRCPSCTGETARTAACRARSAWQACPWSAAT